MYGLEEFNSITPYFYHFLSFSFQKPMYGLNAHVWSRRGGGVTPCSEIIVGDELPFTFEGGGVTPHSEIVVRD